MIPIVTHKATFYKLVEKTTNSNKEDWEVYLSDIPCNIQPAGDTPSERATGVFEKQHIMFIDATYSGIREGYRAKITGLYSNEENKTFQVIGVADHMRGPIPHYEYNLSENLE